jgi:hypothetical protein
LHLISLTRHVYVFAVIPILIMFLLTSTKVFRKVRDMFRAALYYPAFP